MTELTSKTIAELRDGFRAGQFSAREIAEAYNDAVASARALNAFTVETPDEALAAADVADEKRGGGETAALAGIPLGIKDLFATEGVDTTAGSRILQGFRPPYDSHVTANLRKAGAGMLGKLNMDEFAMGSSNETSAYGPVISPWRRKGSNVGLTPGGSSGGSAAAVSSGIAPGATGTDTGGSIRQPAAFAGICGIKPTYGRCSRWGIVAFASSLDQAGSMARTVRDCAILLEVMAGFDPRDSTSLDLPVPRWEAGLSSNLSGKRVGIPKEYRINGVPAEINALWDQGIEWLKDAGATAVEISLPHTKYALPTYYIIAPAEASSNLARYDGV
ncbi:MAG: aspartyl-tRNA(Asn)/glutamyl-tRNA(Gln) amidotransferase subunit, partial [Sphingomonadales bacterium]|nr:aspartyl-tRNA(Asn)/glutamyl-tRNA(Gln) amidotransferase subunit [Sphingomonadales bacterium]